MMKDSQTNVLDSTGKTWSIGRLLRPIRGQLILACGLQAIASALSIVPLLAILFFAEWLLGAPHTDSAAPMTMLVLALAAIIVRTAFILGAGGITHLADLDFQLGLRRRLVSHLSRTPMGWFTSRNAGAVKSALQDDIVTLHHLVGHSYTDMTAAIVTPIVSYGYLLWIDWRLALVAAVPVAIGVALYVFQFSRFRDAVSTYTGHIEAVNASAIEFVQGASVMKTFGHRGARDSRFRASAERFVDFFWYWVRKTMALSSAAEIAFSPLISVILIAVCGIAMVQWGWLETFELLPFLLLAPSLAAPFITLSFAQNQMMLSEEAAARIGTLFEAPVLPLTSAPKTPTGYDVTFDKVSFSYDGETQALSDINLNLKQETVTALVGPSGGGKSTLAQLLPRFWDPTEGEIRLGGVPLDQIDPQQLYRAVGFVFQNVQLVSGSVADNIALGQPDASREAIETAARKAQIYDKITSLPRGFDSIIGEDVHLSGGEAQRVSIARALLVNAPVLVLDEATAYADPQSEAALQKAISELIIGKTVLVIAHRLYTITGADQICVLKNGHIVECGTHDSLLAEAGTYDALWRASQSGSSRDVAG